VWPAYAGCMSAIARHQIEILRRVGAGKHLGGGDVPLANLQEEIDRLLALHLIESDGASQYRLTEIGALVLSATESRRLGDREPPGSA